MLLLSQPARIISLLRVKKDSAKFNDNLRPSCNNPIGLLPVRPFWFRNIYSCSWAFVEISPKNWLLAKSVGPTLRFKPVSRHITTAEHQMEDLNEVELADASSQEPSSEVCYIFTPASSNNFLFSFLFLKKMLLFRVRSTWRGKLRSILIKTYLKMNLIRVRTSKSTSRRYFGLQKLNSTIFQS